jgi:uncharacterized protein
MAIPDATTSSSPAPGLIDCDVHETLRSREQLFPYLPEAWHAHKPVMSSYPYDTGPLTAGGVRGDSWPADFGHAVGPPGSSYELLRDQLLDAYGMEFAVLNAIAFAAGIRAPREYAVAYASAYNDWLIAEWLSRDERLFGAIQVAYQDPESAVDEIDRLGAHPKMLQVMLPVTQAQLGDKRYRGIFAAAARHDLVLAIHPSTETSTPLGYPNYYSEWHTDVPQAFMASAASLIFSGVFEEFPTLRVVMLECEFTWVPFLRWRMDANYKRIRHETPWLRQTPGHYLTEHFYFGSHPLAQPEDPAELLHVVELTGADRIVYASDYPHWDWDEPDRVLLRDGFSSELREQIAHGNASSLYSRRRARIQAAADGSTEPNGSDRDGRTPD